MPQLQRFDLASSRAGSRILTPGLRHLPRPNHQLWRAGIAEVDRPCGPGGPWPQPTCRWSPSPPEGGWPLRLRRSSVHWGRYQPPSIDSSVRIPTRPDESRASERLRVKMDTAADLQDSSNNPGSYSSDDELTTEIRPLRRTCAQCQTTPGRRPRAAQSPNMRRSID